MAEPGSGEEDAGLPLETAHLQLWLSCSQQLQECLSDGDALHGVWLLCHGGVTVEAVEDQQTNKAVVVSKLLTRQTGELPMWSKMLEVRGLSIRTHEGRQAQNGWV